MSGDFNTLLTIGYAIITLGVVISVIIIIIRNIKNYLHYLLNPTISRGKLIFRIAKVEAKSLFAFIYKALSIVTEGTSRIYKGSALLISCITFLFLICTSYLRYFFAGSCYYNLTMPIQFS